MVTSRRDTSQGDSGNGRSGCLDQMAVGGVRAAFHWTFAREHSKLGPERLESQWRNLRRHLKSYDIVPDRGGLVNKRRGPCA
jgi:hypothetical protein